MSTPRAVPVLALIAGNVCFGMGLFFHAFLYNFYLERLQLSEAVMGHAAAVLSAGGLVVLLPAGWVADRLGPKIALVGAAALTALGLALGAVAAHPAPIYGSAALAGAGGGLWRVAVSPMLMRLTEPRTRARWFGWNVGLLVASGGLGVAVAGSVPGWVESGWSVGRLGSVRVALLVGAVATALSAALFQLLRIAEERVEVPTSSRPLSGAAGTWSGVLLLLPLVALVGAWMLGSALAGPFFNIFFSRQHGLSLERIGLVFAASHIVWAVGVFGSGELATRFGVRRVLIAALLLFAPVMGGLAYAPTVGVAIGLYFLQGVIGPATNPLIDQFLLERTPPERRGAISSWRNVAADVSGMVGASVGGSLLAAGAFRSLFLTAAAVGLVGATALIAGLRRAGSRVPLAQTPVA